MSIWKHNGMKTIIILLDGLGDRSYEVLNHLTPLQAASTPNLDRLASLGSNGLFHASELGQCLPSETAHYLLFGYEMSTFPGRGLLEAVGEKIPFQDSDVLTLAHLAGFTWNNDEPILTLGRDEIKGSAEDFKRFFATISSYEAGGIRFRLHQTRRNDAILIISGQVSPFVADSDPMIKGLPMGRIVPLAENPEPTKAERTARALNAYLANCHRILNRMKQTERQDSDVLKGANFLVTQRCGRRIVQTPFNQLWGFQGMLIASVSVYWGLARELGLECVKVKDSENPAQDLEERIDLVLTDNSHDFFHVHTKVPDEAAHTGSPKRKKEAIAQLDKGLAALVRAVETRNDILTVIAADHSTLSISAMIHSGEPVPVAISGPTVRRDGVRHFDEVSASSGCLGLLRGRELMLMILNYADRGVLDGHRLGAMKKAYFPPKYEPFKIA